jgi:hypothetical protein
MLAFTLGEASQAGTEEAVEQRLLNGNERAAALLAQRLGRAEVGQRSPVRIRM